MSFIGLADRKDKWGLWSGSICVNLYVVVL
jgi:hypothetical protein